MDDIATDGLKLYPNSVEDLLFLEGDDLVGLKVYSVQGKMMMNENLRGQKHAFDVSNLMAGVYWIEVSTSSTTYVQRIQKHGGMQGRGWINSLPFLKNQSG